MRGRTWIFAALVAAALVLHLAVLSAKAAQSGEDNLRARLAQSTSALHAQLELLDARLVPRAVAMAPDLIEATRPPADPTQPLARPDERALRAAASALSPTPDLLAVVNRQGAILSRRARAAQGLDDATPLPLAKAALEGSPPPAFASFDGGVYRVAAARIPGNGAAAVVGTLVDDRLASQFKSQVDADVTLVQGGKLLASSLPQGEERARLLRWAAAPAPGYGVLQVRLPFVGNALSGKLPRGATRYAVRGALLPLDSGVQAALTVPAGPYLAWLGRYQAFYALGLALFVLFSLFWGLLARPAPVPPREESDLEPARMARPAPSLLDTDVGEQLPAPPPADDVPWPAAGTAEATAPGGPNQAMLARARGESNTEDPFPGDEPTRIEPVSAALMDKLRERDAELSQAANPGWGSLVAEGDPLDRTAESEPPSMEHAHVPAGIRPEPGSAPPSELAAAPEANVTMQDFSMPGLPIQDPDAQHWQETFDRFKEMKAQLGEAADKISFEKFAAKLRKNRAELLARHNCKGVRFSVYEKDGKASIKATAIR